MKVKEFKERVKNLSDDTIVTSSNMTKDYILSHPEEIEVFIMSVHYKNVSFDYHLNSQALSLCTKLSEVIALPDEMIIEVDVEDGFIHTECDDLLILNNQIILLTKRNLATN